MDFITYFYPSETFARVIIVIQAAFFLGWIILLIRQGIRAGKISSQIDNCEDIGSLSYLLYKRYLQKSETAVEGTTMISPKEAAAEFEAFCEAKQLPENSPLYKHLKAIFFAGFNESQLNIEALIKNTSNKISSTNTTLRSLVSLFIILGLLGTLFGLATSLSELSAILFNAEQFNDEVLKNGLRTLLGKLSGAFAPSIWGVLLTVVGVVLFALYLSRFGFPVLRSLENQTLMNWVPNLIPTPSQRLLDKLRLSEQQMEKNFAAAERVAEFAARFDGETSELGNNIRKNIDSLQKLSDSASTLSTYTNNFTRNLDGFAQSFKESVERLSPVTEGLTGLYQKIQEDSQKFQENVKLTVEDSQVFRGQIQEEFGKQAEQAQMLFKSLELYETAYIKNRQSTDEKIQSTLSAAEEALSSLKQQNEIFIRELIDAVGVPLREDLKNELVNVTESLKQITDNSTSSLADLSKNVGSELGSVALKMGRLEDPIKKSADFIESTATGFENRTKGFLEGIKLEFQNQNQQKENENINLSELNGNVRSLVNEIAVLTGKIEKLNQKDFGQSYYRERNNRNTSDKDTVKDIVSKSESEYNRKPKQGFLNKIISRFRKEK